MNEEISRRKLLTHSLSAAAGSTLFPGSSLSSTPGIVQQVASQPSPTTTIQATKRTLEINGKPANVLGLLQPDGTQGIHSVVNRGFRVKLDNKLSVPTAIHWHGLHPPNKEDGVPGVTQAVIGPNSSAFYDFPVQPSGTHWMHSHQGLQEAFLLAAPLIVRDPADARRDEQEIVLLLSDFSFTPPKEVFANLRQRSRDTGTDGAGRPTTARAAMGMKMSAKPDANDVNYDAYLANDRTLRDPEVVKIEKGGRLRLRIINGASGTNFFIDFGSLTGKLIATDGMPVRPIQGNRFPLAIAQRIDVRVQVPREGGVFPILALRELAAEQTGIVMATAGAGVQQLPEKRDVPAGLLTLEQERKLAAANPLSARAADQVSVLRLEGNMRAYDWLINSHTFDVNNPRNEKAEVRVKEGQRVALRFVNKTPMSHPMHLHGHSFQVVAINDQRFSGAVRDSVLVPGNTSVSVEFDANNPGLWYVHCHVLWHLAAGMATLVQYQEA
jgi:FtsP/CotA-like multicopper oxidase with cupredoxin domain